MWEKEALFVIGHWGKRKENAGCTAGASLNICSPKFTRGTNVGWWLVKENVVPQQECLEVVHVS